MTLEDETIIRLYFDRDENAVAETAAKYGSRLRRLSYGITQDAGTAEECENDTYMEAWNRIPPVEPKTYFYAFLARITRALSIDRCRERDSLKRGGTVMELTEELETCLPAADGADAAVDAKLLGEAISRFLLTLSEEKQLLFLRRYFFMDPVSAIGKRYSMSESKVKMTLLRTRRALREYLVKEGWNI